MVRIENEKFVIEVDHFADGETLRRFQKALIIGLQCIAEDDDSDAKDYKDASYFLSEILKAILLDDSQTNVGLGGKPYASDLKAAAS